MNYRDIKNKLYKFRSTPFHPQWFVYRMEKEKNEDLIKWIKGLILDIGCADGKIKKIISNKWTYVGLDYYKTAFNLYKTNPHVYGDAHFLPILKESVDTVLLLDVLEHLRDPVLCIEEIFRVLKPGGILYLQVPFMYPEHDSPYDYQRWTENGLRCLMDRFDFDICSLKSYGGPMQTVALLFNIAIVKTWLYWFRQRNPVMVLGVLIPFVVLISNIFGKLLSFFSGKDGMMAYGHALVVRKRS